MFHERSFSRSTNINGSERGRKAPLKVIKVTRAGKLGSQLQQDNLGPGRRDEGRLAGSDKRTCARANGPGELAN